MAFLQVLNFNSINMKRTSAGPTWVPCLVSYLSQMKKDFKCRMLCQMRRPQSVTQEKGFWV